ncbi:hypothetical protein IPL85_02595 [Candidatus Saccharibacteria bacterium]|nr:MAG: hypothetical protein IPL85_02595 [Candidatus Saccharibacteria bacterium]
MSRFTRRLQQGVSGFSDSLRPAAPIITSSATATTTTPTINGTAELGTTVEISINNHVYSSSTNGSGVWSIVVVDTLTQGNAYTLTASARNAAGYVSKVAATQNLTVSGSAGTFAGTKVAIIGDSLTYQADNGQYDIPAAFTSAGWPTDATWFYSWDGKKIAESDWGNLTTMQNIAQCRLDIGEPDVWVIALCTNNGSDSVQKITSDMQLVFNALGSSARLLWVNKGDWWVPPDSDINNTIASMISSRPYSMLADWYSVVENTADQTNWWTDGTHMTRYGYSIRNNFIAAKSVELFNQG